MENEFKYQDSLYLFEEIYYTGSGELKKEDWKGRSLNSNTYNDIGVSNEYSNSGRSQIVGRSAFTPRIVRKPVSGVWQKFGDEEYKYFLTLDSQGKFDDHFALFYENNSENINEIDITDMSKEDVLNEVKQMLSMSNEEIMKKFNIKKTYSPQVKLELLLDDIIQEYLLERGIEVSSYRYGPEWGMFVDTDSGEIRQKHRGISEYSDIKICEEDRIFYKLVSGIHEYDDIRVEIEEEITGELQSELGKKLLETLRERFTEKQAEKDEAEQPVQEDSEVVSEYNGEYDEYSISSLESILKQTEDSNRNKERKIKELEEKNELIRKILQAKAKGKELDSRISELNNEFTTPEQ